ncbi:MAG: DNA cytosine methyltransferase [Pseudomonadota bacterium]
MRDLLSNLPPIAGRGYEGPELIVDCFAGGGGASTGIFQALGRHPDYAVNHDPVALAMHRANHPETIHLSKNLWQVDPMEVCRNRPVGLLWASPDCKHFSKAKGGKPVKRNIRDLAWTVLTWARRVRPRVIILENVVEFLTWGPVVPDDTGKLRPCKDRQGETFKAWSSQFRRQGYTLEWREIVSYDHNAPTIRRRLYIIMRRDGLPIVWPAATHGAPSDPDVVAGKKLIYPIAADCIDFSLPCPSIFDTADEIQKKHGIRAKRPLADNTMKRIARGVMRHVLQNPKPFIVVCNHGGDWFRGQSIDEPFQTMTASRDGFGVVTPFVSYAQHGGGTRSAKVPLHTITASKKDQNCLVAPVLKRDFGNSVGQGLDRPAPTVTAGGGGKSSVVAAFLAKHNTGATGSELTEPMPTVTANGSGKRTGGASPLGLISAHMMSLRGSDRRDYPADEPLRAASAGGNHESVVAAFLDTYYGTDQALSLEEPLGADTTRDRRSLVTVEIEGQTFEIVDIGMRMLTPRERFNAQGFPLDYIIDYGIDDNGDRIDLSQSAQGRMCGNSVCPPVAKALVSANVPELAVREVAA